MNVCLRTHTHTLARITIEGKYKCLPSGDEFECGSRQLSNISRRSFLVCSLSHSVPKPKRGLELSKIRIETNKDTSEKEKTTTTATTIPCTYSLRVAWEIFSSIRPKCNSFWLHCRLALKAYMFNIYSIYMHTHRRYFWATKKNNINKTGKRPKW